ncbi:stress response translation initiation inhibitor YciH [Halegenticoccus tardaugens]|uniref:stress response translation initiation inhibitor YciH n=1 Tax=Halegenticoccus tardaugens TaxID=2071624 RepID=UPI00100A550B|nr:stress response translation initiation inhibitor YciH [Halegenticoccus tardaugens]
MTNGDPFDDFDDLDPLADLDRAEQRLSVRVERRRYGKPVTIVEGFETSVIDIDEVASELKRKLATGGTVEETAVELQGDHRNRVPGVLEEMGFEVD